MPAVKPVYPVYNPAHPLSQGLIACWAMAEMEDKAPVKTISRYNDANGICYGFNTSGRVATPYGAGVRQNNDGGYVYASTGPLYAPVDGKFTYAILAKYNNPLANYGNISRNYASNTGFTFHFGGTTGQLRLTIGYGTGTFNWFSSGSPVIEAGRWYMLGFSFDGNPGSGNGPLYWWYDGVPRLVNSSAAYFAPSTTVFRPVADNLNGDVAGAWMWGRHLTTPDWQRFMQDPFAMVRPIKHFWKSADIFLKHRQFNSGVNNGFNSGWN